MSEDRELGVEISLGFPPVEEMQADIVKLCQLRKTARAAIATSEESIAKQRKEQAELSALAANPVSADGITYDSDACAAGAARCDKHIAMFQGLIKKERAKVVQLDYMVSEVEKRVFMATHPGSEWPDDVKDSAAPALVRAELNREG